MRGHISAVTLNVIKFTIMILCYQLVAALQLQLPPQPQPLVIGNDLTSKLVQHPYQQQQQQQQHVPQAMVMLTTAPQAPQATQSITSNNNQLSPAATIGNSNSNSISSSSSNNSNNKDSNGSSSSGSSSSSSSSSSKKGAQAWQTQNLNKFQKYLSEHQQELVRKNPGSLWAVARAIKMAIKECQYQMRHEPWDCPIHGFSVKPAETFGLLMTRSIKETSFIQSLLAAAIAHSVARACTESIITTCSRKHLPHGNGFEENIEFGIEFARNFSEVRYEHVKQKFSASNSLTPVASEFTNQKGPPPASSNSIRGCASASALATTTLSNSNAIGSSINSNNNNNNNHNHIEQNSLLRVTSGSPGVQQSSREPVWKEKRLRQMLNVHNDRIGQFIIINLMRRECKCHGLSGTCTMQTCWVKLPPFRNVAIGLHDSLDKALRVEIYVAPQATNLATNCHKSLTSTTAVKKSNKKRSSSLQSANLFSGLGRSSTLAAGTTFTSSPLMGDTSMDNGSSNNVAVGGTGRLQAHQERTMNSISINNNIPGGGGTGGTGGNVNEVGGIDKQIPSELAQNTIQYASLLSSEQSQSNTTSVKRRPIARSIGLTASTITPGALDLLYAEESPDFCVPNERYNIKGTKGRICSESSSAANSCETLCCGRGYKTEIREEKYTCECKFQYCCNLQCNTCTRRKVIHKCL